MITNVQNAKKDLNLKMTLKTIIIAITFVNIIIIMNQMNINALTKVVVQKVFLN